MWWKRTGKQCARGRSRGPDPDAAHRQHFRVSHRLAQINEVIRRELAAAINTEREPPAEFLLTVMVVAAAADLQNATVWVSVLPASACEQALRYLRSRARPLRRTLFRAVRFRPVPALHFRCDDTEDRAASIEALLDRLRPS